MNKKRFWVILISACCFSLLLGCFVGFFGQLKLKETLTAGFKFLESNEIKRGIKLGRQFMLLEALDKRDFNEAKNLLYPELLTQIRLAEISLMENRDANNLKLAMLNFRLNLIAEYLAEHPFTVEDEDIDRQLKMWVEKRLNWAESIKKRRWKWGYIDKSGKVVIPFRFDDVGSFSEGLASAMIGKKWGFIDKSGKMVIPFRFDEAGWFREGLASVKIDKKWGFIDRAGRMVIPPKFNEAESFSEGLAVAQTASGKYGFINRKGDFVIKPIYDNVCIFSEGFPRVKINGLSGYIRKDGTYLVQPGRYENAGVFGFEEGFAEVRENDNYYYINTDGEKAFGPFEGGDPFHEGIARVRIDGKDMLLTNKGQIIRVEGVSYISAYCRDGRIQISINKRDGYIDKAGNIVIQPKFDEVSTFSEGLAAIRVGKKWGYINTEGKMIAPLRFAMASFFDEGLAHVMTMDGKSACINKEGRIVFVTDFRTECLFSEGLAPVSRICNRIIEGGKQETEAE